MSKLKHSDLVTGNEVYTYRDAWGSISFRIDANGNWITL